MLARFEAWQSEREELPTLPGLLTNNIRNSKNMARRFEVLHRRNYCEGVP